MDVWLNHVDLILIFTIFAVSLNLLLGHAGVLSAAHAALGAIGGYTVAYLTLDRGVNFWVALALGVALAYVFGLIMAVPSLPLSPEYLILLTLVAGEALLAVVEVITPLGGRFGMTNLPDVTLFGWQLDRPRDWLAPLLAAAGLTVAVCWRIGESPYGRVLRGTREDDRATAALGKHVFRYRLVVFGITSALAGLAGGLYAGYLQVASPGVFAFAISLSVFAMVIVGGMGNIAGSVLGAVIITLSRPVLERLIDISPEQASFARTAMYGLLLLAVIRFRPQGLLPEGGGLRAAVATGGSGIGDDTDPSVIGPSANVLARIAAITDVPNASWNEADTVLRASGLTKHFGSVVAAEDLAIELRKGTVTALVGPNGAGKTTVFNLLTGFLRADAGAVELSGRDISGLRPDEIARAGLVRTFQDVRLFNRLPCIDNVAMAVPGQDGERLSGLLPGGGLAAGEAAVRVKALEWLAFVGMDDHADKPAGDLSYGQTKLISLARALATEAPVLLLDEPASGVDTEWVQVMLALVEAIRDQGRTICIVEHNLHVVERLADHAYFMELGVVTAEGTMAELISSPRLAAAYFGGVGQGGRGASGGEVES